MSPQLYIVGISIINYILDFDDEERNVVKSLDDEGELTVEDFHGDIQKILDIVRGNYDGCEEASGIILFVHFCPII